MNANLAIALDQELMTEPGFSLEQLMELAGLSVAEAVYQVLTTAVASAAKEDGGTTATSKNQKQTGSPSNRLRVLVVCGPGNNGGDGLVAARHLVMFGMECTVVYPKQNSARHFVNLIRQCEDVGIPVLTDMPDKLNKYTAVVDAIFGFSFHGEPREPFATILQQMLAAQKEHGIVTFAVDVPSGWNVDEGDVAGTGFVPDVLISLTAPKYCAKEFPGRHFVGGRFLPPVLGAKYGIRMPQYPGVSQVVEVSSPARPAIGWEASYAEHLAEKEAEEFASYAKQEPIPEDDSWEAGYAVYLQEKADSEKQE
jgi:NAD(P)H-hydrate epimerase